MLSRFPVVQLPDSDKAFHVFVDALDIAIGSALMQLEELNWYKLVYYEKHQKESTRPLREKLWGWCIA